MAPEKLSRRDQILQQLAAMMESNDGTPITTAALARNIKVSEAALYRHFSGKKAMFAALIEFIETTLFSRINAVLSEKHSATERIADIVHILLLIIENNPGMSKILTREALVREDISLHIRVNQLFERLDSQIKQVIKEASAKEGLKSALGTSEASKLIIAIPEGLIQQFIRSDFKDSPIAKWQLLWPLLSSRLFINLFNAPSNADQDNHDIAADT
jgi:TetR/AcrR family transcriptional regulator